MERQNNFSVLYKKKTIDELRKIINEEGYQKQAVLAAIWELERRNEATVEEQNLGDQIMAEEERKKVSKLSGQRYQTFWRRLFASIIDRFVMWPVGWLLFYLTNGNIGLSVIVADMLNNFSPYIYSVLLHGYHGQTLGKMVMGVRVVDFDTEDEIDIKQAFVRDSVAIALMVLLYAYSFILFSGNDSYERASDFESLPPMFYLNMLSVLWIVLEIVTMLFDNKSRAVHDLIARTVVVRTYD